MSTQFKALLSGLEALEQGRYIEAINLLEMFCQLGRVNQAYWQAQIGLVQAYHGNGQKEKAIALCRQLLKSEKQTVKTFAQQFLCDTIDKIKAHSEVTTPAEKASDVGIKRKNLSELKIFFQHNLVTQIKDFENKRREVLNQITSAGFILLVVILALIGFFPVAWINFSSERAAKTSFLIIFLFLLAAVGCMWFWVVFYTSSTETCATGFKSTVIQEILNFIDDNRILTYSQYADTQATLAAFQHSQIFQSSVNPTKITQDDCVAGKIGETDIFFSEVCAEIEYHNWLKRLSLTDFFVSVFRLPIYLDFIIIITIFKGTSYIIKRMLRGQRIHSHHFEAEVLRNDSHKIIFKGLFFQANFNKNFQGKTVVLPAVLVHQIQSINKSRGEVVKLEDPEFNNLFIVYGDDQVESRYILSTSLMEKLAKFRKKAERNIYVSFVESRIYIAIEYAEDLFEPLLFKTMLSFAPIREYFETFQLMIGVVEELNLNRRIWKKE